MSNVILLGVVVYFFVASIALTLWVAPDWRTALFFRTLRFGSRLRAAHASAVHAAISAVAGSNRYVRREISGALRAMRLHRGVLLIAMSVILMPPLLAVLLRPQAGWHAFDEGENDGNALVGWLLRGERLAPPQPLPPEVFATYELSLERPALDSANRDWSLIDTGLRAKLLQAFRIMSTRHGYAMTLLEGYRSPGRQRTLAAAGTSVTNADAFQSLHQYGLAADCAFFKDGQLVISERDPWAMRGYQLFGEVAEAVGLTWGGRWKLVDLGHVELRRGTATSH